MSYIRSSISCCIITKFKGNNYFYMKRADEETYIYIQLIVIYIDHKSNESKKVHFNCTIRFLFFI